MMNRVSGILTHGAAATLLAWSLLPLDGRAADVHGTTFEDEESTTEVVAAPDSVPIRYTVHGTGSPTLVFVHGWMSDKSYWEKQLLTFSRRFEVVAVDLAGHGESGLGRQAWTIASFGDDVAAVVKELDLELRPPLPMPPRSSRISRS